MRMKLSWSARTVFAFGLTHLCLASHKWGIGKQCRPRSDAAERGVWSGSTLFAIRLESFNNKSNYDDFYITPLYGPFQSSWWESLLKIFRHKWVKVLSTINCIRIAQTWSESAYFPWRCSYHAYYMYQHINPFMPNGFFYLKSLDWPISSIRGVCLFIITMFYRNSCI